MTHHQEAEACPTHTRHSSCSSRSRRHGLDFSCCVGLLPLRVIPWPPFLPPPASPGKPPPSATTACPCDVIVSIHLSSHPHRVTVAEILLTSMKKISQVGWSKMIAFSCAGNQWVNWLSLLTWDASHRSVFVEVELLPAVNPELRWWCHWKCTSPLPALLLDILLHQQSLTYLSTSTLCFSISWCLATFLFYAE